MLALICHQLNLSLHKSGTGPWKKKKNDESSKPLAGLCRKVSSCEKSGHEHDGHLTLCVYWAWITCLTRASKCLLPYVQQNTAHGHDGHLTLCPELRGQIGLHKTSICAAHCTINNHVWNKDANNVHQHSVKSEKFFLTHLLCSNTDQEGAMSGSEREHLSNFLQFGEILRHSTACISAPWLHIGRLGETPQEPKYEETQKSSSIAQNWETTNDY